MSKNALFPGSFDPLTLGHVNIIERVSPMFDKIYVAVMNNDSSKYDSTLSSKTYMFTPEQRLKIVQLSISHIKNAEAVLYGGMLIDFCDEYDTCATIRGVRNAEDLQYEMIHAKWNREHNPRAEALFVPAEERFDNLSSTKIRKAIAEGDILLLEGNLSPDALTYIKTIINLERN